MLIQYIIPVAQLTVVRGANFPLRKLYVKTVLPPNLYFALRILLVFSTLLFHVFFGLFSGDSGFWFSHPHPDLPSFLKFFFECWVVSPVQWPVGPLI